MSIEEIPINPVVMVAYGRLGPWSMGGGVLRGCAQVHYTRDSEGSKVQSKAERRRSRIRYERPEDSEDATVRFSPIA